MNQDIDRQRRFHIALQDLLTQRQFSLGGTKDALLYFCKVLCRELHVPRAGIWLLNEAQDKITPFVCWDSQNPQSEVSGPLSLEDARSYFEAIRQDHILAIDDVTTDPRCAELQRSYLPANHILSTGEEALQIFQADPSYDLLLTDIVMPGNLQGPDLARACRQIKASLPVVFLSGYANEELVAGKALDRNDVRLDKPMKQAELLHTLGKVLSAPI